MYIAICDDNIADRKQMERLLKREADKYIKAGDTLYTDSFGNQEALLSHPMQYDAFFIDMCHTEGVTTNSIVRALFHKGVTAPIVLCCSEINYREEGYPENVFFLDKPIHPEELSEIIARSKVLQSEAPGTLELRDDKGTYYVTEPDILYATRKGRRMLVQLQSGRVVETTSTLSNLFSQWESFKVFVPLGNHAIINCRYVKNLGWFRIYMKNDQSFFLPRSMRIYIQEICARVGYDL